MAVEETRNELVGCGFVTDMLELGEKLPHEVVLWFLEHGNPLSLSADLSGI
jgi:hypothetical protein